MLHYSVFRQTTTTRHSQSSLHSITHQRSTRCGGIPKMSTTTAWPPSARLRISSIPLATFGDVSPMNYPVWRLGVDFYELSTPAGHKCSGAPVSELTNPWHVIGVYVGERRNDTGTLAVGYATRTEALHAHWPALFGTAKLSALCVAGRA